MRVRVVRRSIVAAAATPYHRLLDGRARVPTYIEPLASAPVTSTSATTRTYARRDRLAWLHCAATSESQGPGPRCRPSTRRLEL